MHDLGNEETVYMGTYRITRKEGELASNAVSVGKEYLYIRCPVEDALFYLEAALDHLKRMTSWHEKSSKIKDERIKNAFEVIS